MDRKDKWLGEDDEILSSIVLKHIQSGSTQLKAFEEVAEVLGRTAAACGFRWNSEVRKLYEEEILQAKKIKNGLSKKEEVTITFKKKETNNDLMTLPIDQVIETISILEQTITKLREDNKLLRSLKQPNNLVSDDLQHMLRIIDNARKLGLDKIS